MGNGSKRIQSNDKKAKNIRRLLDSMSSDQPFFNRRSKAIPANLCVFCETPNTNFRDQLSQREYRISGMCQNCQDNYFKEML
jgi:hypothetical protein